MRKFNQTHQWVDYEDGLATIGITTRAVEKLGEINYIELPVQEAVFMQDDILCIVESAKTASDILTPVGGTVTEINMNLEKTPELVSTSPEGEGWICQFTEVDPDELESLMSEEEYEIFVEKEMEGEE